MFTTSVSMQHKVVSPTVFLDPPADYLDWVAFSLGECVQTPSNAGFVFERAA